MFTPEVKAIWMRNYGNTMKFTEAKLGINSSSSDNRDKELHHFLKGAFYEMGRNLTTDLVAEFEREE